MSNEKHETACGRDFKHDGHIYHTPRGKIQVCDGVFNDEKRKK